MRSLRWRIALSYAVLLVIVITVLGILITVRLSHILYDQAREHVVETMGDVIHTTLPAPNSFGLGDVTGDSLLALQNPDNLERWASPTTFVQIDDPRGYVVAKSFNMGAALFPLPVHLTPEKPQSIGEVTVGKHRFLIYNSLLVGTLHAVIVQIGEPLDEYYGALAQAQRTIAIILIAAVIAVTVLSFFLAAEATNPINELAHAMREITSEHLNRRLHWRGRSNEIGRLAQAFDELLARLEEAFARERQFISDASHELKTPLTSINANAQLLARWGDRDPEIRAESVDTIIKESASLAQMVTGMLTLAKADSGEAIPKEPISLGYVARGAIESATPRALEKDLYLRLDAPDPSPIVLGDEALLRQLIANLVDNAIKFTQTGGVTVRIGARGAEAFVEVADTGPGIDPQELPLIFGRFYRTDKSRTRAVTGTGLGLAIARSIARVHNGSLEAAAAEGGGTVFRVRLPVLSDSHPSPGAAP